MMCSPVITPVPTLGKLKTDTDNLDAKAKGAQVKRQESRRAGTSEQLRRSRVGRRHGQDPVCRHGRARGRHTGDRPHERHPGALGFRVAAIGTAGQGPWGDPATALAS